MNFYDHHIGDYDADTAHLTWVEDMAYTRLLRLYYRKEAPIPADLKDACRLVRAVSKQEREAVETVLREFFVLGTDGWHQSRCDAEIEIYRTRVEHNRRVGKMGGRPRKVETREEPAENPPGYFREPEKNPPQTPVTIPHTPGTEPVDELRVQTAPSAPPARKRACPPARTLGPDDLVLLGVDRQHAADWIAVRKAKNLPLTQTAWDQAVEQAKEAGLSPGEAVRVAAANGWGGFRASWLASCDSSLGSPARPINRQMAIEAENRRVADQWLASQPSAASSINAKEPQHETV